MLQPSDPDAPYRTLPRRAKCRHDVSGDCEVHGCPFCQDEREQRPWINPCQTCVQLRDAAFEALVALNPMWQCEREGCTHCEVCEACSKGGNVCRDCRRCKDCQDDYGPCWAGSTWSRVRKVEVPFSHHVYLDRRTGLWTR